MNTEITYEYRDGGNNRVHETVVVAGVFNFDAIKDCFNEDDFFIPSQVGMDDIQWKFEVPLDSETDHVWRKMSADDVTLTDKAPTVEVTAEQLTAAFRAAKGNWNLMKASVSLGLF